MNDALREIELDRQMGKLTEADYHVLRAQVERRLAEAQAARPAPAPEPGPVAPAGRGTAARSTSIDRPAAPPATLVDGAPTDPEDHAEWLVRRARTMTVACPECGVRPEPDARYCSHCGRFLARCPSCGRTVDEIGARFCIGCGTPLAT